MNKLIIKYKKLVDEAEAPFRKYEFDAGFDLTATSAKRIGWFKYCYGTGLAFEIPHDYEMQIRPRSSVHKTGMLLANSVGTIDCTYTGEVMAVFWKIPFIGKAYKIGDRICQAVIKPIPQVEYVKVNNLTETERGDGGFGSTGV